MKVYLDTCVIITLYSGITEHRNKLRKFIDIQKPKLLANKIALMECLVQPVKRKDNKAVNHYKSLFQTSIFEYLPIDDNAIFKGAQIRAEHNLKVPDALHVASAINSHCDFLCTFDKGILKKEISGLKIIDPLTF